MRGDPPLRPTGVWGFPRPGGSSLKATAKILGEPPKIGHPPRLVSNCQVIQSEGLSRVSFTNLNLTAPIYIQRPQACEHRAAHLESPVTGTGITLGGRRVDGHRDGGEEEVGPLEGLNALRPAATPIP